MKPYLLLCLFALSAGCANRPTCQLPKDVRPLPPAHSKPYRPTPWVSFDGSAFPYSYWPAQTSRRAKAVVILAPGWDGTMTDYAPLAEYLAAHGYTVYGSEQRGGIYDPVKSRQGDQHHWEDWVRDFQAFSRFVTHRQPGLPVFYHGHSFGTLVVLLAPASPRVPRGVILQSLAMPFLIEKENPALGALVATVHDVRFPHLRLAELLNGRPTGDEQLSCQWLHSSDRVGEGYTGRYFEQAAKLGHAARASAVKSGPPVLALEGLQDNVVAPRPEQKQAYHRFLTEDLRQGRAKVIPYQNGFHTITIPKVKSAAQTADSEKAMRDIVRWLDAHR